jgi:hypothetical protein
VTPLDADALAGAGPQVLAAWRASMAGTRAELSAASRSVGECGAPPDDPAEAATVAVGADPVTLCLEPLVRGSVVIRP